MNASEFGVCRCGFKKIDHGKPKALFTTSSEAPKPASEQPPKAATEKPSNPPVPVDQPTSKEPAKPTASENVRSSPCNHFEVDLKGTFGHCKCGFSREDHKSAGTIADPEPRVFAGVHIADAKRSTVTAKGTTPHPGKQAKPCDNYQVDMNGQTYGDCLCGHARMKHKQFQQVKKTQNVDPEEEEVVPEPEPEAPKVIIRDGEHPCEKFELDLANTGGYGHCLCGFVFCKK